MSERITSDGYWQVSEIKEAPHCTRFTSRDKCAFDYYHGELSRAAEESVRFNCGKCGLKLVIDTGNAFDIAENLGESDMFPDGSCLPGLRILLSQSLAD